MSNDNTPNSLFRVVHGHLPDAEVKFRSEFQELLDKYGADVTIEDPWSGASCGPDLRVVVSIPGPAKFSLGRRIRPRPQDK